MTSLPLIASVRLTQAYAAARANALEAPLERILQEQSAGDQSLDPALRDSILLITILVGFLESPAQRWRPLATGGGDAVWGDWGDWGVEILL